MCVYAHTSMYYAGGANVKEHKRNKITARVFNCFAFARYHMNYSQVFDILWLAIFYKIYFRICERF